MAKDQPLAFPRQPWGANVPATVIAAQICEALALTDENAVRTQERIGRGVRSVSVGGASESYTGKGLAGVRDVLCSSMAARLMAPYMAGVVRIV